MAVEQIEVEASAEAVWEVLADSQAYAAWVVGTQRIRGADHRFPDPGTRLYHSVGAGPLSLSDTTSVVEAEPPTRLVLHAHAGPLGTARVVIDLHERDGRTVVTLTERGSAGPSRVILPAGDLVLRGRNRRSLERLKAIVEARA